MRYQLSMGEKLGGPSHDAVIMLREGGIAQPFLPDTLALTAPTGFNVPTGGTVSSTSALSPRISTLTHMPEMAMAELPILVAKLLAIRSRRRRRKNAQWVPLGPKCASIFCSSSSQVLHIQGFSMRQRGLKYKASRMYNLVEGMKHLSFLQ